MDGRNFMYIILEKAKPYTRIKRGRVERVRGYTGRPKKTRFDIALDKHRPDVRMALRIAEEVKKHRGRALIVGGFVRDVLLNRKSKDLDIEVYGLSADNLNKILSKIGKVDAVGTSFGVLKVKNDKMMEPLDVSLPRHDNLVGVGHKGFVVETDKGMTPTEAAKRRDLTMNSMAYDPLKKLLIDPFGGAADIKMKKLKATDVNHFAEDPLRVLRVMQFAGRFGFAPDAELVKLSRSIDLRSLPKERLYTEFEKLLLKSKKPSKGLIFMPILGVTKLFPELERLMGTPQDPDSHPEGDAWEHTLMVVDAAREFVDKFEGKDKIILMLAALLHDVGKPDSTEMRWDWEKRMEFEKKYHKKSEKNKIISYGHQNIGVPIAEEFLRKITDDAEIIDKVKTLIASHMLPSELYKEQSDSGVRRLAKKVSIPLLIALTSADKIGRGKQHKLQSESWLIGKYKELQLDKPDALKPLVMGRHLIEQGMKPGKEMGKVLDDLYEAQLEGKFKTTEEGLAYMKQHKEEKKHPMGYFILPDIWKRNI